MFAKFSRLNIPSTIDPAQRRIPCLCGQRVWLEGKRRRYNGVRIIPVVTDTLSNIIHGHFCIDNVWFSIAGWRFGAVSTIKNNRALRIPSLTATRALICPAPKRLQIRENFETSYIWSCFSGIWLSGRLTTVVDIRNTGRYATRLHSRDDCVSPRHTPDEASPFPNSSE